MPVWRENRCLRAGRRTASARSAAACFLRTVSTPYQADFERITDEAEERPYQALLRFFFYIKKCTRTFRERYAANMHRTVRWAIREQMLTVIEPYIERILNVLVENGAEPTMNIHQMAIFLAHGVGSLILHEDADWVDSGTDAMRRTVNLILGLDENVTRHMRLREEDLADEL